jgi:hypothetical protein
VCEPAPLPLIEGNKMDLVEKQIDDAYDTGYLAGLNAVMKANMEGDYMHIVDELYRLIAEHTRLMESKL